MFILKVYLFLLVNEDCSCDGFAFCDGSYRPVICLDTMNEQEEIVKQCNNYHKFHKHL